jgi:hypothetical protein
MAFIPLSFTLKFLYIFYVSPFIVLHNTHVILLSLFRITVLYSIQNLFGIDVTTSRTGSQEVMASMRLAAGAQPKLFTYVKKVEEFISNGLIYI